MPESGVPLSFLTESLVRQQAARESFQRGREYYHQRAVVSLMRRGNIRQAEVEGSQVAPYRIRVIFDGGGITEAVCDCSYEWGGWCKHIVATLMACVHQPEAVAERPTLAALLADLDRDQLQHLVLGLAERDPSRTDVIESQIALLQATMAQAPAPQAAAPRPRQTAVDAGAVRRQVHTMLRSLAYGAALRPSRNPGGLAGGPERRAYRPQGAWAERLPPRRCGLGRGPPEPAGLPRDRSHG